AAAALQAEGFVPRDTIAICGAASIEYLVVFFGALRAGLAVAPLSPGATPAQLAAMAADADARRVFVDAPVAALDVPWPARAAPLRLDEPRAFESWLAAPGTQPAPVQIDPQWPFNL